MSSEGAHGGPGPPQERGESRWRRKRPAPPAARPLILFSMISALVFIVALSVIFLPRILETRQDIPQFTLDVTPSSGGVTIRVSGATMPQAASAYKLELFRNGTLIANASLPGGNMGITYTDANRNGLLDRGDSIFIATEPGHGYLTFLYYIPLEKRVAKAEWQS